MHIFLSIKWITSRLTCGDVLVNLVKWQDRFGVHM